jgi:phosphoenolpyruvate-protein kinase (PTS system EI component)
MANGYTFYGNVIGINKKGSGPALRPDIQNREQGQAIMGAGPYVVVADRVLEDHDWCLHHPNIQGIVAEYGGATSHGAVVAREEAIACVVNAKGASHKYSLMIKLLSMVSQDK